MIGMLIAVILVAIGIIIVAVTTNNFGDAIEREQDSQLDNVITGCDVSISDSIDRFDDQMERYTGSDRFKDGVAGLENEAEGALHLKQLMQNSFVSNQKYGCFQ